MAYKVIKERDNFMVEVDGNKYPIGKLNDQQLQGLLNSGKYQLRNGDRMLGHQMRLFALMEKIDRGVRVRKVQ